MTGPPDCDRVNVGALYDDAVAETPDETALVDATEGTSLSYRSLAETVARTGNACAALGVPPGDRVALLGPNTVEFVVALLAVVRLGAVAVPVNLGLDRATAADVLADCDARVAVVGPTDGVPDRLLAAVATAEDVETVAVLGGDADAVADAASLAKRRASAASTLEPADVDPDDPAIQPYTSGSTGRPKGVVLTHGGVEWNTAAFVEHLGLSADERGLVVTPLYHKNAMTGVVKPMLRVGGSVVLHRAFDATATVASVEAYGITYLTGVPAVYKRLAAATDALAAHDVSTLTWASCGSAAVPDALVERFERRFDADLLEVYGLTEGGPVVAHSPRDGTRKVGSAGPALPGVETLVVDPDTGRERPPGEPGEMLVASPGLGTYYGRPEATEAAMTVRDGTRFLRTGDLVTKDAEGYHFVHGRLDDMLVVGGENLYPAELEDVLQRHDAVADVAVVGVPHAEKGEAPVAFVVAVPDATPSPSALREYALRTVAPNRCPRRVFLVDDLPLTGSGKVDYVRLEAAAKRRVGGSL